MRTQTQSVNRAGFFNDNNPGKRGISLNMTHPKGKELFKRLVGGQRRGGRILHRAETMPTGGWATR